MKAKRTLLYLIIATTVLSAGHHIDHIIRGNHVGWPLTNELTPFSFSIFIYIPVTLGFYLQTKHKIGAMYWFILTLFGFGFVAYTHLLPDSVEPPKDILFAYPQLSEGVFAFSWLVLFNIALLASVACSAYIIFVSNRHK